MEPGVNLAVPGHGPAGEGAKAFQQGADGRILA
jgi:hypothetical protein